MKKVTRIFLLSAFLMSFLLLAHAPISASANTEKIAKAKVEKSEIEVNISIPSSPNETVSILIIDENDDSIAYLDQITSTDNYITFETVLPAGSYYGYLNTSTGEKIAIDTFTVIDDADEDSDSSDEDNDDDIIIDSDDNSDSDINDKPVLDNTDKNESDSEDLSVDINNPASENNSASEDNKLPTTGAERSILFISFIGLMIAVLGCFIAFYKNKHVNHIN